MKIEKPSNMECYVKDRINDGIENSETDVSFFNTALLYQLGRIADALESLDKNGLDTYEQNLGDLGI